MAFDGRLLAGVSVLAAAVESGSFVRAAEVLGLSASGVSRSVSRLESRIGVRLLDRTTRALHLTDEGARFYEQVVPHLDGIHRVHAEAEVVKVGRKPSRIPGRSMGGGGRDRTRHPRANDRRSKPDERSSDQEAA
jgi:DNA-binding transcriptional LysR family regulator